MKKYIATLFVFILLILLTMQPIALSNSYRHVNPYEVAPDKLLPSSLFLFLSKIGGLIATEKFNESKVMIEKFLYLYTPADLRLIIDRIKELLNNAKEELNKTKVHISNATSLFNLVRLDEAKHELNEAKLHLLKANKTVSELEYAAKNLESMLRAKPKPFLESIEMLKQLILKYKKQIDDLLKKIEEYKPSKKKLIKTVLTISVNNTSPIIGTKIKVMGNLTTFLGEQLSLKKVEIYFDKKRIGDVYTNENGSYSFILRIPYIYKDEVAIYASYLPHDKDKGYYSPSISKVIRIKLIYDKPKLQIHAPTTIYPGLWFKVQGSLKLNEKPLPYFNVFVKGFGKFKSAITKEDGSFTLKIYVPANTTVGNAILKFKSSPKMIVGPATSIITLKVDKIQSKLKLDIPKFIFAGAILKVKGFVYANNSALQGAKVYINVGNFSSSASSLLDGSFDKAFFIPFSTPTASYTYSVIAVPEEPWIIGSYEEGSIFVINPLSVFIPFAVGMIVVRSIVRRKEKKAEESIILKEVKAYTKPTVREGISELYWKAVSLVSRYTGISMKPSQTVREYLKNTKDKLKDAYSYFMRLSLIYEKYLYSHRFLSEDEQYANYCFKEIAKRIKNEDNL